MAIRHKVTRGLGNGTFEGDPACIITKGLACGVAVVSGLSSATRAFFAFFFGN
jgi:hypothetical protein